MEMNIPKKFKLGGVDYDVWLVKHCGTDDDFGLWRPQGIIEIANQVGGYEVSDLMIGDKVMVKVLSQIPNTYVLHTWTANDYSRNLQVKPIPLTSEILEKNGWWYEIKDIWLHDEVSFCIEKWNRKFQCYDINQIKLDSVHQLQQTLRLCGLNNLADDFKV